MPRVCEVCQKGSRSGKSIVRHGLRKSKGGIGLHTTGITARQFRPNLQRIRVYENGGYSRKTVCARCLKSGKVQKSPI